MVISKHLNIDNHAEVVDLVGPPFGYYDPNIAPLCGDLNSDVDTAYLSAY